MSSLALDTAEFTGGSMPVIVLVEQLTPSDLEAMEASGPHHSIAPVRELKPSHHAVARYFASGFLAADISRLTGYSQVTLSFLLKSPAFQDLLAYYQGKAEDKLFDVTEKLRLLTADTLAELHKRVLENPDDVPTTLLTKIATDLLDRHPEGHGPVTRSINKNIHVGLTHQEIHTIKEEVHGSGGPIDAPHRLLPEEAPEADPAHSGSEGVPAPAGEPLSPSATSRE